MAVTYVEYPINKYHVQNCYLFSLLPFYIFMSSHCHTLYDTVLYLAASFAQFAHCH